MKNLSNFAMSRIGLVSLFCLCVIIFSISFVRITNETILYKTFNSSISLSNQTINSLSKIEARILNCEASLEFDEEVLTDISGFNFNLGLNEFNADNHGMTSEIKDFLQTNKVDKITFTQEKVMILPGMKMIHLIGSINMGDVHRPIAFQLAYTLDKNKRIAIKGKQKIYLNEFGIKVPTDRAISNEIEIDLDINLTHSDTSFYIPKVLSL